ncbi:MAG: PadR family transcriptional regulator [Anaerolineae bacterium]|nr:PadR family transcriptional regulator [Anaerolineae bacterium]
MSDQRRLPLEQALLGFLTQGSMHGYDLHRHAQEELGRIWHMGISNIYSALKQLEQDGYVESTLSPQNGRPPRKVYCITRPGRKSFRNWVKQPVPNIRRLRVEFLAKLYFLHTLGMQGVEDLIMAQKVICQEHATRLKQGVTECESQDFDRLVFDFRLHQIEAILEWLETCRKKLAS